MHSYLDIETPQILAHQGLARDYQPNSILAFAAALEAGADYIETDAHGTKDGVAVLFHDDEINGIALSQISSVDLPEYVPRLDAVLSKFPGARFNIDIKNAEAAIPVAHAVNTHRAHGRILLTSFQARRRRAAMSLAPGTACSPSVSEFTLALVAGKLGQQWLVNRLLKQFDAVQIPARGAGVNTVTPRLIRMYHEAGVKVHVWTINEPEEMKLLIKAGVDGIVTDRTDLAVSALKN